MYWRIYCKTQKQDGAQGAEIKKGTFKVFSFYNESESDIPQGYYIDLTAEIEARGTFERIPAQHGWDDQTLKKFVRYDKSEWWHFQYTIDVQETFLDELELIGLDEDAAINAGWNTDALLDHKPG